jgi:D-alanyl-D-alanine carboxypeptidase/D-alanyl-D-alanine-endopeptidase (penicillin-binding protein 4)
MKKLLYFLLIANSLWLTACSVSKQISKQANKTIFADSNFTPAHVGISIYDPSTNKYLYNYQGDKYFVPASNMKLFTCYAAMKHLGDSLVGLRYSADSTFLYIQSTADPTFLHPDFAKQPVYDFIKTHKHVIMIQDSIDKTWKTKPLGRGWAWDDYSSSYMAERSSFPIYGNVATMILDKDSLRFAFGTSENRNETIVTNNLIINPPAFRYNVNPLASVDEVQKLFTIERQLENNLFEVKYARSVFSKVEIPFITSHHLTMYLLKDTVANYLFTRDSLREEKIKNQKRLEKQDYVSKLRGRKDEIANYYYNVISLSSSYPHVGNNVFNNIIHSQPTDSLLKPMMHRSDNFFAEQTLLMVSNETLGYMSDTKIIDSLLKTDFSQMPQKPKWVDGSGLSRYNLITPQDFVWVLNKMKQDFTWERITTILPTGNEGTLVGLYKNHVEKIYAKTGTLSNNVALSGFITTNKGKQLIFSILVNNHQTSATNVRKTIEKFLVSIMDKN